MNRKIILSMLGAVALMSFGGQAGAVDISAVAICKTTANQAERAMRFRQGGGDVMKLIEDANRDNVPEIFTSALKVPVYDSKREQDKAVVEFRDKSLAACLERLSG